MVTDLTNNDNAGTVVSRINTAIDEQNKGVDTLGTDPNASTVISRVNAAIDAENNDQLEDVTSSMPIGTVRITSLLATVSRILEVGQEAQLSIRAIAIEWLKHLA